MKTKSIYTKKLGAAVARGANGSAGKKFHVISYHTKWIVVSNGTMNSIKSFTTENSAIAFATNYAKARSVSEVVVHNKNGGIDNSIKLSE